jgi:ATP-binding cassette, subfamily B, bacterial PglK
MRQYLKEIIALMGKDTKKLPWLLVLFFMVSFLDIAGIGIIGPYISMVLEPDAAKDIFGPYIKWFDLPSDAYSLLMIMSFVLLGIFFIKTISAIWINYIIINFTTVLRIRLSTRLMNSYQSLPYVKYIRRNSSEYIHATQNLAEMYATGFMQIGLKMVSDGIVALVILVMLAITDFKAFFLLSFLLGLFVVSYDRLFRKKIKLYGVKQNLASLEMIKGIHEGLEGLKEIRVLGHESYFLNKVKNGVTKSSEYSMYRTVLSSIPRYLIEFLLVLFIVLLVILTMMTKGSLTELLPTLAIFGIASLRLLPIVNILSNGVITFRFHRDGVSRLYNDNLDLPNDELGYESSLGDLTKAEKTLNPFETLKIKNVSFTYPNAKKEALKHINLTIKRGDSIGIMGESGSGKTTLIDTILGLLVPDSGEIYFNDVSLTKEMNNWHKHIAYLPQEVFLIDDKLKSNVALGVDEQNIDIKLLDQSLKKASLISLIEQLPDGVNTVLGERGVRLSGGQRQRIALARAFYHKRDILIMDESTSALDNETEKEIINEIKNLKGDVTMIVIAHRISTLENCDTVYKINKGEIVSSGPPQPLSP